MGEKINRHFFKETRDSHRHVNENPSSLLSVLSRQFVKKITIRYYLIFVTITYAKTAKNSQCCCGELKQEPLHCENDLYIMLSLSLILFTLCLMLHRLSTRETQIATDYIFQNLGSKNRYNHSAQERTQNSLVQNHCSGFSVAESSGVYNLPSHHLLYWFL